MFSEFFFFTSHTTFFHLFHTPQWYLIHFLFDASKIWLSYSFFFFFLCYHFSHSFYFYFYVNSCLHFYFCFLSIFSFIYFNFFVFRAISLRCYIWALQWQWAICFILLLYIHHREWVRRWAEAFRMISLLGNYLHWTLRNRGNHKYLSHYISLWPGSNAMQNNTIQYNTIQYIPILCNTIQYNTILYYTMQWNTIELIALPDMSDTQYRATWKHCWQVSSHLLPMCP